MSRSQQIRDALAGAGDVHFDTIMLALDAPAEDANKVRNILSALRTTGEIGTGDEADTYRALTLKQPRPPEPKPAAPKVDREKLRQIADNAKAAPAPPPKPASPSKALAVLFSAGELLRATLRDQVDGIEDNDVLRSALALHESAEQLAKESA